jgi:cell division septation protein DedD
MNNKLRTWMASPAETRTAWIIASMSIVLVVSAFSWPMISNHTTDDAVTTDKPQHPIQNKTETASIEKIIAKAQTQERQHIKSQPKPSVLTPAPVPTPKVQAAKASTLAKGYYVQVGAFKEQARAETLQKKLAANWATHIKSKPNNLFAVWAGPYPSSKEAERVKTSLASRAKIKGFIVKN